MPIQIRPDELRPLDGFEMSWRWTMERYSVLPPAALVTIRPLTYAGAGRVWDLVPRPPRFDGAVVETSTEELAPRRPGGGSRRRPDQTSLL